MVIGLICKATLWLPAVYYTPAQTEALPHETTSVLGLLINIDNVHQTKVRFTAYLKHYTSMLLKHQSACVCSLPPSLHA